MTNPSKIHLGHLAMFLALMILLISANPIQQSEPIRVLSLDHENNYPDGLTFQISIESDSSISKIRLYYRIQGSNSTSVQPVDPPTDPQDIVSFTWDTSGFTVAPSSRLSYYWTIEDKAGNKLQTPDQHITYDDLRFPWTELRDEELIVRWYDGDQDFGDFVYQTAREALSRMEIASGMELQFPVYVLLYTNDDDFASWHSYVDDWVGGQAFSSLGVTTEIIPPTSNRSWIQDVIPHEIAHLFFYQTVNTGIASWPSWLDEGLAQYYEFGDNAASLDQAAQAAAGGRLLPLSSLTGGFGRDTDQVRLAYAESFSAVTYILEVGGDEALQSLVEAFQQGLHPREAIQLALGQTWEEFIAAWITWMGVPATPAPSPQPTPTLVFPTAPSGWPSVTPRAAEATATSTSPPTSIASSSTPTTTAGDGLRLPFPAICSGAFGIAFLPATSWILSWRNRRKRRE